MITHVIRCPHCMSTELVRNGFAPNGKQKYRCRACGRQSRDNPGSAAYSEARKAEILRAYHERSRRRGLMRTFGVSRNTVVRWIKKSRGSAATEHDVASTRSR